MRDIGKSNLASLAAAAMAAPAQEKIQGIEASGAVVDEATRFAPSPEKMLGEALPQEQIAVFKEMEEKYAGFEERMAKRRERSLEEQAEMKAVRDQDFQHLTRLPNVKKGEIVDLAASEEVLDMLMDFRNYPDYSDESLASWVMTFTEEHEQQKPRLLTALMFRHASRMLGTVGLLTPAERHHMMWSVISVFMPHLTGPLQILDFGAILEYHRQDKAFPTISHDDAQSLKERAIAQVASPESSEADKTIAAPIANGEFPKEWRIRP